MRPATNQFPWLCQCPTPYLKIRNANFCWKEFVERCYAEPSNERDSAQIDSSWRLKGTEPSSSCRRPRYVRANISKCAGRGLAASDTNWRGHSSALDEYRQPAPSPLPGFCLEATWEPRLAEFTAATLIEVVASKLIPVALDEHLTTRLAIR